MEWKSLQPKKMFLKVRKMEKPIRNTNRIKKKNIGYGFGAGIAQARLNALNACHEAELKKNTSYVVTEKEELIGPLGVEATETFMVDNQSYRDIKSKLSPITVSKVMSALEASAEKEITAQVRSYKKKCEPFSVNIRA